MTITVALLGPLLSAQLALEWLIGLVNAQVVLKTAQSAELLRATLGLAPPNLVHSSCLFVQLVPLGVILCHMWPSFALAHRIRITCLHDSE